MPTCVVCLDALKEPAALPCGHVFCYDCVTRLIRSVSPFTTTHYCPTCNHPYTISNIDPSLVPHHLRQHVTPSVRKLQLEYQVPVPLHGSATNAECERLLAENASLRTCCFVWRKRAAVHATATMGFVGLARLARDYALKLKKERDDFEVKYNELKKLYEEKTTAGLDTPPESPSCPPSPRSAELRSDIPSLPRIDAAEVDLPPSITRVDHRPMSRTLYRLPSTALSEESFCSECPDCLEKKRKHDAEDSEPESAPERPVKRSHSISPSIPAPAASSPQRAFASYLEDSLTL